ncbi:MAG: pitrilysin family protein [Pseudomonadota bacterium]|nr:peptidase M16 [Alphaproteobacteria bacterium]MEC7576880.1 pitrilysin family protein [Pseudomonadota bacterium]MCS5596759.1 insulinase family protein [Alphaproteobacteria bacterium]MEC7702052.1 pitrilysin family protein [Pseudomonadota bacterium]MEC9236593.1 pitrilysin family protein [Pseudomonadota bacterium]|tara:strand:- start:24 stop:1292 length:1269 start_codon:yes stop_codon:yes gene_type:complete
MSVESRHLTTLDNGLRIITDEIPHVHTVATGVYCGVGTRHEDMAENGVAHMVEHMLFKGTKSFSATQLAEAVENLGGSTNAFTGRETTGYYIHLMKEDLGAALNVLSEQIQLSTMPPEEIERERGVILQEIGMYADTPDEHIFDIHQETAYANQTLGAPILGTPEIIKGMSRESLTGYVERLYTPNNMVISVAGNAKHDDVVAQVEKLFTHLPAAREASYTAANYTGGECRLPKDGEQAHVIVGFQGVSHYDDDNFAAKVLSQIMGGGMSSRLFQEIREKRGLVYSIYSYNMTFNDDGHFGIYAGTDPKSLPELLPVLCEELNNIRTDISEEELKRAKARMRAGMLKGEESVLRRNNSQAGFLLKHDKVLDIEERIQMLDAVQIEDVLRIARRIFASKVTLSGHGPLDHLERYDDFAARLAA